MAQRQDPSPLQTLYDPDALDRYCRQKGIRLVVLFGSHAHGTAGSHSDVDLAVQMQRGAETDKLQLIFDLEGIFSPHRVDLVILNPLTSPLLLHEVFLQGRPLYEAVTDEFKRGRLRAWKLYQDSARLRRLEKRALEHFVRRVNHVP
ncbi:MAG TPA: hypothetical protein DCZ69_07500 [Syntrophobacteraceae bacterium]|nr:hypothetical protein [Syntrophobacteraceae bacterium]HBZ56428.1 hypothetical protein [Syntrophobacteraceae bacterium]